MSATVRGRAQHRADQVIIPLDGVGRDATPGVKRLCRQRELASARGPAESRFPAGVMDGADTVGYVQ